MVSEIKAHIGRIKDGHIIGWVTANESSNIEVICGNKVLGSINELTYRQDVVDAGFSKRNTGFSFDATDFLNNTSGSIVTSIRVDGKEVTQKEFYIPLNTNFILNPYMLSEGPFSLKNINIHNNYRNGLRVNRFVSPSGLVHSNGSYTRISFDDRNNTQSITTLALNLDPSIIGNSSQAPLELVLVAKSSHPCNIHASWLDEKELKIYDEPVLIDQDWSIKKIVFSTELSTEIRSGALNLELSLKHFGRRYIDFAMIALTEDFSRIKTPIQDNLVKENKFNELALEDNLLNNGELTQWSKGVDFSLLKRSQELADNWFLEMSKQNADKDNIQITAITDNVRQDPLAEKLTPKFGLRARTKTLDRYARLVCLLNVNTIHELDYELSIDIEANSFNNKVVLPVLYFIPRSMNEEKRVIEIARKVPVIGRQILSFKFSSYQINSLLAKTQGMPILALSVELPSHSDVTVYSANFKVANSLNEPTHEDISKLKQGLFFEDNTILEQLHMLNGLDSWIQDSRIEPPIAPASERQIPFLISNKEFATVIHGLTPHNMVRPARNFPFIDIIIPVYNACEDVLLCLSSLIERTDLVHRIIIVNDGEDERTANMLKAFESSFNHVEVLDNPVNIGYTKSVNKGIKHSNADWVVVLNSDTIVSEGWLGHLMNCALSAEKVGMVGPLSNAASWQSVPKIHDDKGDWHLNPLPKGLSINNFAEMVKSHSIRAYPEVGVINGFCQLINMQLLDEIGLLDEDAFPVGYGEENDMCARAVKAGYKLLIADDTYVFHAKSKSFGHEQRKKLAKQGSAALKKKHPDVNWGQVTKSFKENIALNELRNNLSIALKQFEDGEVK